MMHLVEGEAVGVFNAVSPPGMFTMGNLLSASIVAAKSLAKPADPPRAVWVPADFLEKQKVQPWGDMPVWIPESGDDLANAETSAARALHAGLKIRPIRQTVTDTLAWHLQRPEEERAKLKSGLTAEREKAVLDAWHASTGKAH